MYFGAEIMNYMTVKTKLAVFFYFCSLTIAFGQPIWSSIVGSVFSSMDREVRDSLKNRKAEFTGLSRRLDSLIALTNTPKLLKFGVEEDRYFTEGMAAHLMSPPGFQVNLGVERNKDIVAVEQIYLRMYNCDLALADWKTALKILEDHPDRTYYKRWELAWLALPSKQRPAGDSKSACEAWLMKELACDLVKGWQVKNPVYAKDGLKSFNPKWWQAPKINESAKNDYNFPIPPEGILASFPTHGQFAFDRAESVPGVGYIRLNEKSRPRCAELMDQKICMARWTNVNGKTIYTTAEFRMMEVAFFYLLPIRLDPEMLYRLEIIALPNALLNQSTFDQDCLDILRSKDKKEASGKKNLQGESIVTSLYFRTSKYVSWEKLNAIKGTINWERYTLEYKSDEPFDPIEMEGNGVTPGVINFVFNAEKSYSMQSALNDPLVYYYLTVPRVINGLDSIPLSRTLPIELDHTMDEPFIRNVSKGNPASKRMGESRDKDMPLAGSKYVAPEYKQGSQKDYLTVDKPVPFITKELFGQKKTIRLKDVQCAVQLGELKEILRFASAQQKQLNQRIEERAKFFYELDKRKALRAGKPFVGTLTSYRQIEMDNLPEPVRMVVMAKIPDVFNSGITINYLRKYPGTEQSSMQGEIKFNKK
jgi:hypothetical protein